MYIEFELNNDDDDNNVASPKEAKFKESKPKEEKTCTIISLILK